MYGQPGQSNPDMAVEELLAGRSGSGVVVHAGTLDMGTIPFRRGIVDGEDEAVAGESQHECLDDEAEKATGHGGRSTPNSPEDIVKAPEVHGDARGTEPRGEGRDSPPALPRPLISKGLRRVEWTKRTSGARTNGV